MKKKCRILFSQLKESLSKSDGNIYCFFDEEVNPIEVIFFYEKRSDVVKYLKSIYYVSDENFHNDKVCVFLQFKEIGIRNANKFLYEKSRKVSGSLREFNKEGKAFIIAAYMFIVFGRSNYIANSGMTYCKNNIGTNSCEELMSWFINCVSREKITMGWAKCTNMDKTLVLYAKWWQKVLILSKKVKRKIHLKLYYKLHYAINKRKNRNSTDRFEQSVRMKYSEIIEWTLLKNDFVSMSGVKFARTHEDSGDYFYKGAEVYFAHSVENEIKIQEQIEKSQNDKGLFLKMDGHADDNTWLKYPYVEGVTLGAWMNERKMSDEELLSLGEFLVKVVDELYKMKVIHRDLRANNIMVSTREEIVKLTLIDFGSARLCSDENEVVRGEVKTFEALGCCGDNRYNERIIDDAASAYIVFRNAGADEENYYAKQLKKRIGRIYYSFEYK